MKCLRILYCTHMWTVRIQGIGYWAGLLGFELIVRLILSYDLERRTWLKMTFVNQLIVNPLWRVIICYVEMIGVVIMWQLHVVWFLDVVGDCIYDMWWWIVNDCIYTSIGDGEVIIVCVNICICSWVICSCIHDWWWWILYPRLMVANFISNWGEYDVFVASKVTSLRCFGTTCI